MENKKAFFDEMNKLGLALTYDDVRLKSGYSEKGPKDVSVTSKFSRNIPLFIPIVSAAMDTVTESKMAIAMAKAGGLGIVHKALTVEEQASQVKKVKLHLNGLIEKPICVKKDDLVQSILNKIIEKDYQFRSFPVVSDENTLLGIITQSDLDFCLDTNKTIESIMTPVAEMVVAKKETTQKEALVIMEQANKKALPLIDEDKKLSGMFIFSDIKRLLRSETVSSNFNLDKNGHLRVGAAIGTGKDEIERARVLVEAGVDVLVIDTAHGDSKNVYDTLKEVKNYFPHIDVVVGNVSEGESAKRLVDAGADGIKVGQGPGSICTTRIIAGIGCPQVTAVYNCAKAIEGSGVPICADGGIRNSGDITIAIGSGASCVMLGRTLAGTIETPGEIRETLKGKMKVYRGMGSLGAMQANKASRERYRQEGTSKDKLVPEGVESMIPLQGNVADIIFKQVGGLRSGMGYVGAETIEELKQKANFHRLSNAGLVESYPHDITIINQE